MSFFYIFFQVCNIYRSCSWFETTATVSPRAELTSEQIAELKENLVETEKKKRMFICLFLFYF